MHAATLLSLLPLVLHAVCEELKPEDVPEACTNICAPIVTLTGICHVEPESEVNNIAKTLAQLSSSQIFRDDARRLGRRDEHEDEGDKVFEEKECVCSNKSFDVNMIAAYCAGCLADSGGIGEDMSTIMSQCNFATSGYEPAVTSIVADVTVAATRPTGTGVVDASEENDETDSTDDTDESSAVLARGASWGLAFVAVVATLFL